MKAQQEGKVFFKKGRLFVWLSQSAGITACSWELSANRNVLEAMTIPHSFWSSQEVLYHKSEGLAIPQGTARTTSIHHGPSPLTCALQALWPQILLPLSLSLSLSLSRSLFHSIAAKLQPCCYPHHLATAAWMMVSLCHQVWSELSVESNVGPVKLSKMNQEQWGRACAMSAIHKGTGATLPLTSLQSLHNITWMSSKNWNGLLTWLLTTGDPDDST